MTRHGAAGRTLMDVRRVRQHTGIGRAVDRWRERGAADATRDVAFLTPAEVPDRSPWPGESRALARATRAAGAALFHATYPQIVVPRGVATLLTVYDTIQLDRPLPWRSAARLLLSTNIRRAVAVMTCSEHSRAQITERLGAQAANVHVVPIGIDLPPQPTAAPDTGRPYLLYVGNAKAHKHVAELVEWGSALFPSRGLRLVAVVPEPALRELRAAAGPAVELRASVPEAELDALRDGALASVSLAEGEGFGLPPLEAAARGLPALLHDAGAHREVLADAAVYCALDPDSFATAVDELLARRDELAVAARLRAEQFTWERSWSAVAGLYDRVHAELSG